VFPRVDGHRPSVQGDRAVVPPTATIAESRSHPSLRHRAGQPLFLYFAPTTTHTPWLPAAEFKGRSDADRYGDFAAMADVMIGPCCRRSTMHKWRRTRWSYSARTTGRPPPWHIPAKYLE